MVVRGEASGGWESKKESPRDAFPGVSLNESVCKRQLVRLLTYSRKQSHMKTFLDQPMLAEVAFVLHAKCGKCTL